MEILPFARYHLWSHMEFCLVNYNEVVYAPYNIISSCWSFYRRIYFLTIIEICDRWISNEALDLISRLLPVMFILALFALFYVHIS